MPQIIAFALIGGVVWYGYKAFKREMVRVKEELEEAEKKKAETTKLQKDIDGVYRPIDKG